MTLIWHLDEASIPRFSPAEVRKLTGASVTDLQNWANRGLIKPVATKPGKGGVRLYDKNQLCLIRLAKWLAPLGIEASAAFLIGADVVIEFSKFVAEKASENGMTRHRLIKAAGGAIAVVRSMPEPKVFGVTILDISETQPSIIVEHALRATGPNLFVPVGLLVMQLALGRQP